MVTTFYYTTNTLCNKLLPSVTASNENTTVKHLQRRRVQKIFQKIFIVSVVFLLCVVPINLMAASTTVPWKNFMVQSSTGGSVKGTVHDALSQIPLFGAHISLVSMAERVPPLR
jgi:uncharacterized membrane protein YdjX (TVP38/TMEM64 family)